MAIGSIYYSGGYRHMPSALIKAGMREWWWDATHFDRAVGIPRPELRTFWWEIEYPRRIIRRAAKHARRAFQTVRKLYGPGAVPKWRPYIMMKFMKPMWDIEPEGLRAFRGKIWAEEIINLRYSKYKLPNEFAAAEYAKTRAAAFAQAAKAAEKTTRASAAGAAAKGAAAASRAAAQAGATGAAKGVTNRVMRNRLLKRIAQGTFKFAQSKTGAFTAAVLGGLIALTIAGASYVRRNPSEIALAQLRQRRATRYPRAPSGLVFALHATR